MIKRLRFQLPAALVCALAGLYSLVFLLAHGCVTVECKPGILPALLLCVLLLIHTAALWIADSLAADLILLLLLIPTRLFAREIAALPPTLAAAVLLVLPALDFCVFLYRLVRRTRRGQMRAVFSLLHLLLAAGLFVVLSMDYVLFPTPPTIAAKHSPSPDQAYLAIVQRDIDSHDDTWTVQISENWSVSLMLMEYRPASHTVFRQIQKHPPEMEWLDCRTLRVDENVYDIETGILDPTPPDSISSQAEPPLL